MITALAGGHGTIRRMGSPLSFVVDALSWCSVRLRLFAAGTEIGIGTGITVTSEDGESYLVTNWHVYAGRHADTGELASKTGAEPDLVEVEHHSSKLVGR